MAWVQEWRFPFEGEGFLLELFCSSDWQLGSSSCSVRKIDHYIERTLGHAAFLKAHMPIAKTAMILAGDLEDEDRPSTREMRASMAASRPEVAERDAIKHVHFLEGEILPRLRKLHEGLDYGVLGGVAGHHWTFLQGGVEVAGKTVYSSVEYVFARLEEMTGKPCVYLGPMVSFLDFKFAQKRENGEQSVRQVGLLQHGEGGGQTKGATINRLDRTAQGFDADFYIRGHDCQLVATKADVLYAKNRRTPPKPTQTNYRKPDPEAPNPICSRTRTMLNLGSYTMGYEFSRGRSSYVEQGMLRPATMGSGILTFEIRKAWSYEDKNQGLMCETFARI